MVQAAGSAFPRPAHHLEKEYASLVKLGSQILLTCGLFVVAISSLNNFQGEAYGERKKGNRSDKKQLSSSSMPKTNLEKDALVVIDPGHGGNNLGAKASDAAGGFHEKRLTLILAKTLGKILEQRGLRVVYTRTDDRFLSLRNRTAVANRVNADVFISLHANASPTHEHRGFETYILSPEAVAIDAPALRPPGTNRAQLGVSDDATAGILDSWQREKAVEDSVDLSKLMQSALERVRGTNQNRGAKQSSMHVLLGARMPAVLVEVGFIDHPEEGPDLFRPTVQRELSEAIADAVSEFLTTRFLATNK